MTSAGHFKENPLLESLSLPVQYDQLPRLLAGESLTASITPATPVHERVNLLARIENHFVLTPIAIDIADALLTAIYSGYLDRNPCLPEVKRQRYAVGGGEESEVIERLATPPRNARCLTVEGITGLGKSTIVDRTLALLPQVIEHGPNDAVGWSSQKQLVWIKVTMTSDGSRRGFLMQIYQQVDAALGTNYFDQYASKRLTIEHHMVAVSRILFNCFLGALIIEEIQQRNFGEVASRDIMLLFFLRLANLGIPIVLIGNPTGFKGFEDFTQDVRRLTSAGKFELWPALSASDRDWVEFMVPGMLEFNVMPQLPALKNAPDLLFRITGGVPDFLAKIVAQAQMLALRQGKDRITDTEVLAAYHGPTIRANHPLIRALVDRDLQALRQISDVPCEAFMEKWGMTDAEEWRDELNSNDSNSSPPQRVRRARFEVNERNYQRRKTAAERRNIRLGEQAEQLSVDDLRRDGLNKVLLENFEAMKRYRRNDKR